MTNNFSIPPFLLYFIGALFLPFLHNRIRQVWLVLISVLGLISVFLLENGSFWKFGFQNLRIALLNVDNISLPFGYIFSFIAVIAVVYSLFTKKNGELSFALIYAGSSLGVVFSGDFISLFVFWEIMAITSTMLILYRNKNNSFEAAVKYIIMHILGGSLLLGGIAIHYVDSNSISVFGEINGLSRTLMLLGIGLNTCFVGLHTWLTDSYPKATIGGAVFMASFTTKVGVYALIRVFGSGGELIMAIGAIMIVYGIVFALMQSNARKLLSYHIISQVGYMVVAVGIGSNLAINGSIAHVINNIFYKSLLFMCMGSLLYSTGVQSINKLGGIFKKAPVISITCIIASLSIAGFPGFNGYISKEIIKTAAIEEHILWLEIVLILGTVGTILSFLKLNYYVFFNSTGRDVVFDRPPTSSMNFSMTVVAGVCLLLGVYPYLLFKILPYNNLLNEFNPFGLEKILSTIQLFSITFAAYFIAVKLFKPYGKYVADIDMFYQKIILFSIRAGEKTYSALLRVWTSFYDLIADILLKAGRYSSTVFAIQSEGWQNSINLEKEYSQDELKHHYKITPSGRAVLIITIIFALDLLFNFIWNI